MKRKERESVVEEECRGRTNEEIFFGARQLSLSGRARSPLARNHERSFRENEDRVLFVARMNERVFLRLKTVQDPLEFF